MLNMLTFYIEHINLIIGTDHYHFGGYECSKALKMVATINYFGVQQVIVN